MFQQRFLRQLERHLKSTLNRLAIPSLESVREQQYAELRQKIITTLASDKGLKHHQQFIAQMIIEDELDPQAIASAFLALHLSDKILKDIHITPETRSSDRKSRGRRAPSDSKQRAHRLSPKAARSNEKGSFKKKPRNKRHRAANPAT